MLINLHLVIAILSRNVQCFFSTTNLSLLRFRCFVCFTHTVVTVCLSLISISEGKPFTGASTRNTASSCAGGRRGGRRALAVSWCWGWGWRRPTKTKNTTSCHTLHMLCLACTNNLTCMQCKLICTLLLQFYRATFSVFLQNKSFSLEISLFCVFYTHCVTVW